MKAEPKEGFAMLPAIGIYRGGRKKGRGREGTEAKIHKSTPRS